MTLGIIFNIQRSSLHDGPGIRTTVFTKGCSLRCFWCHNPEGLSTRQELQYFQSRCAQCGECVRICPTGAAKIGGDGKITFTREVCQVCGECVEVCPENARSLSGQKVSVEQVMNEILQDQAFYDSSNGGVTFSGGEPLAQVDFLLEALQSCKAAGIHTAIETAGNYSWSVLEPVLPWVDLVMMDLKIIDPLLHKQFTGVSNEQILENSRRLALTDKPLIFRTPVIPGVNDTKEAIGRIAGHVESLMLLRADRNGRKPASIEMELLAFHPLAADKYHSLDILNPTEGFKPPSKEQMSHLESVIAGRGVRLVTHN